MEHPLISDIDNLTIEQLQDRINDLTKKYNYALRTNADLARQISMALETFRNKYNEKQQQVLDAARKSVADYSNKIDIS
jgi:predicted phage tail protein